MRGGGGGGGGGAGGRGRKSNSRERNSNFSLDFSVFGPSVLVGPRSKVVLRGKGYVWERFWGLSTTPRCRGFLLLDLIPF